MAESEESLQLKRRARRRVVGAIALVTFVVIILPLLLDKEPGPAGPPLDVQIPRPESGASPTRIGTTATQSPVALARQEQTEIAPAGPEPRSASASTGKAELPPVKAAPPAAKGQPSSVIAAPLKAATAAVDKVAVVPAQVGDKAEQERAQGALRDEAWVVSLDAFADAKNVKLLRSRLSAAGVKSYTEPVKTSKGELTRVRAGPFGSKEAAEKARAKLVAMGLKPGAVASR